MALDQSRRASRCRAAGELGKGRRRPLTSTVLGRVGPGQLLASVHARGQARQNHGHTAQAAGHRRRLRAWCVRGLGCRGGGARSGGGAWMLCRGVGPRGRSAHTSLPHPPLQAGRDKGARLWQRDALPHDARFHSDARFPSVNALHACRKSLSVSPRMGHNRISTGHNRISTGAPT